MRILKIPRSIKLFDRPTPDFSGRISMIGKTVSHYKILETLGGGGMGVVYKAEDTRLKRLVALKFLPAELTRDPEAKERFVHEAQAASSLDHPNVCNIHEIDATQEGQTFIVMAYYEGETLKKKINRGRMRPEEALDLAIQASKGLSKAHRKGIVHRDIKPANIMVTGDGVTKIVDFGLAKLGGQTRLTRTGMTMGTVAYMSPEQARGEEVDERTDIWSLGVVLYELLTGQLPFKGEFEQAVIYSTLNEEPKPVSSLVPGLPGELRKIMEKLLSKEPGGRYQTCDDLIRDLQRIQKDLAAKITLDHAMGGERPARRPVRWIPWVIAFAAIAALAVSILPRYFTPAEEPPEGRLLSARKMLAVLPFKNLGAPDDEYFADGITDAITARLAGVHGLGVISRQSSIQYKNSDMSVRDIGQELGVDYILEGTIQRERPRDPTSRVRVIPQLIRVSDDIHLWAGTYDEDMTEVFRVQSEIAERVAAKLDVVLLEPERRALRAKPTDNLEAYEYFLRGNEHYVRRVVEKDALAAVQTYKKAVDLDPDFAVAWAALSKAYIWLYWAFAPKEEIPKARAAADEALRHGSDLPETHIALGFFYYYSGRDYERALEHFEEALKMRPSEVAATEAIGYIRRRQGRFDEAIQYFKDALKVNPRDYMLNADGLGWTNIIMSRYEEAESHLNRAMALAPDVMFAYDSKVMLYLIWDENVTRAEQALNEVINRVAPHVFASEGAYFPSAVRILADTYTRVYDPLNLKTSGITSRLAAAQFYLTKADLSAQLSKKQSAFAYYDSARTLLEALARQMPDRAYPHSSLGLALAGLGLKDEAIREGERAAVLMPFSRDAMGAPFQIEILAEIYARVGEYEKAIDRLEKLMSYPSFFTVSLLHLDPVWDPLRGHPRFQRLLEKHSEGGP